MRSRPIRILSVEVDKASFRLLEIMVGEGSELDFEVTEGIFEPGEEPLVERMVTLKGLGAGVTVDDFGTGYSSPARLKDYPIDGFKIDRAFVEGIESGAGGRSLCAAIVALGAALQVKVVAEGVETRAQLDALRETGCNLVQGFLLCRPVPLAGLAGLTPANLADRSSAGRRVA